jgi:hypothetical protein
MSRNNKTVFAAEVVRRFCENGTAEHTEWGGMGNFTREVSERGRSRRTNRIVECAVAYVHNFVDGA